MMRFAIIGAGVAGLACARALAGRADVTVFDKGRGPGGRISSRRAPDRRAGALSFDHGAQYFTARDARFRSEVERWIEAGAAARWEGTIAAVDAGRLRWPSNETERFVGAPTMSAIARHLADGVDVLTGARVIELDRVDAGWRLVTDGGGAYGPFDRVLVTAPAPQAAALAAPSEKLSALAAGVTMEPCWAAMVALEAPLEVELDGRAVDGLFVNGGPLSWAARNSSKPGRAPAPDAWVLHATPEWTRAHLGLAPEAIARHLLDALEGATGIDGPRATHADAHRWMFASAAPPLERGAAFDAELGLGLGGDWLAGSKVQGAWLSGFEAATLVMG